MIKNLSLTFGSKTKAQEIVFLLNNAKEVVRQGFYEQELPAVEKFCQENNIFLVKSKFKVLLAGEWSECGGLVRAVSPKEKKRREIVPSSSYEKISAHWPFGAPHTFDKYSNKGIRISEKNKRPGMYFVYLSKDEQKAWLAAYYELVGNDKDLGLLLGYPRCCVDFFCKKFSGNNPNLELKPISPYTNLSKREQDCVLISHFPCSSDCEESIELGKKHLQTLRMNDLQRAKELIKELTV